MNLHVFGGLIRSIVTREARVTPRKRSTRGGLAYILCPSSQLNKFKKETHTVWSRFQPDFKQYAMSQAMQYIYVPCVLHYQTKVESFDLKRQTTRKRTWNKCKRHHHKHLIFQMWIVSLEGLDLESLYYLQPWFLQCITSKGSLRFT